VPTSFAMDILVADRIWIATALLHQIHPDRDSFKKQEIRDQLEKEGLAEGIERSTINAHLDQHCVSNNPPSSGKYRMLYESSPGNLRLFRRGDLTHPARIQRNKPSKSIPLREKLPEEYRPLLDWYEGWSQNHRLSDQFPSWEEDPLIRLIGSGRDTWADEHADEYVNRLREESE